LSALIFWGRSVAIHSLFGALVLLLFVWRPATGKKQERVQIEVIQYPKAAPTLQAQAPLKETKIEEPKKSVFGLSRKAILSAAKDATAAEVKLGNTVAKAPDNEILDKNDPDQLPIPADEFLVSKLPRLLKNVYVPYPESAKKQGLQGPVVMDLLIDETGLVRQVTLVKGIEESLDSAALAAAKSFQFSPGQVGEKSVAVKIRYTYRFVLEDR
jgi:TonB family protein